MYIEIVFLGIIAIPTLYFIARAMSGKIEELRRMPFVDAISEAVDRAVEQGKPVYMAPGGSANLQGIYAVMTLSGLNVMKYASRLCYERGATPKSFSPGTDLRTTIEQIFQQSAATAGHPERYDPADILWYGTGWAASMGQMGDMTRYGASAYIDIGAGSPNLTVAYSRDLGAITIGGGARYLHQGSYALCCDYPLFMDDVYAAGSYCSDDLINKSSLTGGDIAKLILIVVILGGAALTFMGVPFLKWLTI